MNVRAAVAFSIPSLLAVYCTRRWLVPAIPQQLGTVAGIEVSKEMFILVLFAVIMGLSALSMIVRPRYAVAVIGAAAASAGSDSAMRGAPRPRSAPADSPPVKVSIPLIALEGAVIGVLTGVVGAGGGFAIVPALAVFARLPMRVAVGTSLTIIAAKSLFGFLGDLAVESNFDWGLLLAFTALAVGGNPARQPPGPPGARYPAAARVRLVRAAGGRRHPAARTGARLR